MKTDNALKKALLRKTDELPYGFEDRVMRRVMLEVERKGRLSYYRALGLVSFVSLVLIAGVIFVLNTYFHINFLDLFASVQLPSVAPSSFLNDQTRPIIAFSIYIGILMLFLLGMDYLFRQRIRKTRKN
jgi:stalled ribosome alternative rescue factor ArfA